ncbi:hypothetical protein GQ600_8814 [Phytophthora cactorum]|nr:hypothetical protein GQ600_8814 [Phytophthora cactorum]
MDAIAVRMTGGRIVAFYEALVFSANLRLRPNFMEEEHMNLVHETLDLSQFLVNGGLVVGGAKETRAFGVDRVLCSRMSSRVSGRLIVMREVQSIACTGRTRFISLAFSIFELCKGVAFSELWQLGVDSVKMLDYFALIPGTEEIRPQYNPSTYGWCWAARSSTRTASRVRRIVRYADIGQSVRRVRTSLDAELDIYRHQKQQLTYWRNLSGCRISTGRCRTRLSLSSPYLIVDIILFGTLEYWLVGRSDNGGDFFSFIFVFYLYTSAYVHLTVDVGANAERERGECGGGRSVVPPASSHVNEKATSGSRNLMPSSYSPEALVSGQFGDIIAVTSGDNTTDVTVAQYIEETYAFRPNRKYNFMVDLVVIWAWCSYLFTSHSSM